jgi:DNA-binding transcriptional ArsR family regulator
MERDALQKEADQLHAEICAALADPRRIVAIYALAEKPHTVNELAADLGMTQSAASRHLKVLRERGLVQAVRQGASVEYHLCDMRLIQALDLLRSVLRDDLAHRASLVAMPDAAANAAPNPPHKKKETHK